MANSISILSSLRLKGALVLDDDTGSFPQNPQLGMLVIKGMALYAYTLINAVPTWYPLIKVPERYTHTQASAGAQWTIYHGLNSPDIWYQIQDNDGQMVYPMNAEALDDNVLRLTFAEPLQGNALLVSSGVRGAQGSQGAGVPVGGAVSQVLSKASNDDFDFAWIDMPVGAASQEDPYAQYDVLKMRFQGANGSRDFVEDIGGYTITTGGGVLPYLSNEKAYDGISSLRLTGAGHVIVTPQNNQLNMYSGDWTVDAMLFTADQSVTYASWMSRADSQFSLEYDDGFHAQRHTMLWNEIPGSPEGTGALFSPDQTLFGSWDHVRWVRCENSLKLFVNKKLVNQRTVEPNTQMNFAAGGSMFLGVLPSTGQGYNGYLGYLRITAAARTRDSFLYDTSLIPV